MAQKCASHAAGQCGSACGCAVRFGASMGGRVVLAAHGGSGAAFQARVVRALLTFRPNKLTLQTLCNTLEIAFKAHARARCFVVMAQLCDMPQYPCEDAQLYSFFESDSCLLICLSVYSVYMLKGSLLVTFAIKNRVNFSFVRFPEEFGSNILSNHVDTAHFDGLN